MDEIMTVIAAGPLPSRPVNDLRPCVTLRLDLAEIARRLATAVGGTGVG